MKKKDDWGRFSNSSLQDYPSIGQISAKLSEKNVNIIFAVTQSQLALYQTLTELIDGAVVGELKQDSSNIVNLISQNYKVCKWFDEFADEYREYLENLIIGHDDGFQWFTWWFNREIYTGLSRVSHPFARSFSTMIVLVSVNAINPNALSMLVVL